MSYKKNSFLSNNKKAIFWSLGLFAAAWAAFRFGLIARIKSLLDGAKKKDSGNTIPL